MLAPRIIPCLDVSHRRVVKGVRFQGLRDAGDPAERAALYEEQGADEIVILDVSATPEGRGNQVETVQRVRARLGIPLTVGGGVRVLDDARALLEAGADKVSVNTAAAQGAGEILLTSWDRDGTREGYDLELIRAVREAVDVPVIASGGAAGPEHLREAFEAGRGAGPAPPLFYHRGLRVARGKP